MKKITPLNPLLVALLLVLPSLLVMAQSAAPNAGSMLKQAQPGKTSATPVKPGALVDAPANTAAALPSGAPFLVKSIQISGNKKIDTATLHALVEDAEGQSMTIAQLEKVIFRITEYYNSHGFPLARAIIPAQTIEGGVVNIQIIIARYGSVSVANQSKVNDGVLISTLSTLKTDAMIEQADLDRALLLLSDLPGVVVNTTLTPGAAVGTSDLKVTATAAPSITANVITDNYGNSYTGRYRVGGTVNIVDPMNLKNSDNLSISALSSGMGMNYARVGYESVINGDGTRLGGSYSALRYVLGGAAASADASGTAQVASLWIKHPLIRSRDANVYAQMQFDGLVLKDKASIDQNDRTLTNLTASVSGDVRDKLLSGAVNTFSLGLTGGNVGSASASQSAALKGNFWKVNASVARLQALGPADSVYASYTGQRASKNLDPSQKMSVGGASTVRAYDTGAVSGDSGDLFTAEYRHDFGSVLMGQLQGIGFIDRANMTINKDSLGEGNTASLTGAGLGLNWTGANQWSAKTYIATPIFSVPTQVGTTNATRGWLEVGKGF